MKKELLTSVVTTLVNKYADSQEYGVTLLNIPDFNYEEFANDINSKRSIELFLLGFDTKSQKEVADKLSPREGLTYSFSVEDAEASRNNGDEGIFRVLIIKRSEMEKISSLRWFPEIDLEKVYTTSCDYVKNNLGATNNVIESMIKALRSKAVRQLLSFERVLDYLDLILNSPEDKLPEIVRDNYYTLGLLSDKNVVSGNPNKDDYVLKIKRNHSLVERIGNLEQTERQSITNYYAKAKDSKGTPRKILSFYKTKELMNDAIFKFKRYEDSSLSYTGIDKHEGMDVGGWDTVLKKAEYDQLFYNQQATMEASVTERPDDIDDIHVTVEVQKKPNPTPVRTSYITGQYGIKSPIPASKVAKKPADYVVKTNGTAQQSKPEEVTYDESKIVIGATVLHKAFGKGTIVSIDKKKSKIDVKFANGQKSFIIEKGNQFNAFVRGFLTFEK